MDEITLCEKLRQWPDNWDPRLGFALVHALSEDRFKRARIPGSMNVPAGQERVLFDRFDKDKEVIVYGESSECRAGQRLARHLISNGFSNVRIFAPGVSGWREAGRPVSGIGSARGEASP